MSRVLCLTRHITGHFGDESFQAITCTGTDNPKQARKNTRKTQYKQTRPIPEKHTKPKKYTKL